MSAPQDEPAPRDGTRESADSVRDDSTPRAAAGTAPESDDGRRRVRRRRRAATPADMPEHAPRHPEPDGSGTGARPATEPARGQHPDGGTEKPRRTDTKLDKSERGLRGLVGAGPSQLSTSAAMRARDATQPTAADLAAAQELAIIRRNYIPPSGEQGH